MDTDTFLIESANNAAQTVGTDLFAKLAQNALNLTADEIGRHLDATDESGLFSPVDVENDGKDRLGAVLAIEGRMIVSWQVGTFRAKRFSIVIPYTAVETLEQATRPGGAMSKERAVLRITVDGQTWTLVFANVFEGGTSIVPFLIGVFEGSLRPVFVDHE